MCLKSSRQFSYRNFFPLPAGNPHAILYRQMYVTSLLFRQGWVMGTGGNKEYPLLSIRVGLIPQGIGTWHTPMTFEAWATSFMHRNRNVRNIMFCIDVCIMYLLYEQLDRGKVLIRADRNRNYIIFFTQLKMIDAFQLSTLLIFQILGQSFKKR